jgi:hypothetical protein
VPEPRLGVIAAQLDGSRQRFFPAHGVTPAQQNFPQVAIRSAVRGPELARLDESGLGFGEKGCIQIHAAHREHHRGVLAVPSLRAVTHLAHQVGLR